MENQMYFIPAWCPECKKNWQAESKYQNTLKENQFIELRCKDCDNKLLEKIKSDPMASYYEDLHAELTQKHYNKLQDEKMMSKHAGKAMVLYYAVPIILIIMFIGWLAGQSNMPLF